MANLITNINDLTDLLQHDHDIYLVWDDTGKLEGIRKGSKISQFTLRGIEPYRG